MSEENKVLNENQQIAFESDMCVTRGKILNLNWHVTNKIDRLYFANRIDRCQYAYLSQLIAINSTYLSPYSITY